jgi:DNA-binding MarR family transcriptional regulator
VPDDLLLPTATSVRRGVTRLSRRLRAERPERGETLLRLSVLSHLYRRGPLSPGALAAAERLQPQSLTRTLTGLEQDQLISRHADAVDRRRSVLAITEDGREALRRDMRQRDSWLALAMAAELTPTEQEVLRLAGGLMERLAESDGASALRSPRNGPPRAAGRAADDGRAGDGRQSGAGAAHDPGARQIALIDDDLGQGSRAGLG